MTEAEGYRRTHIIVLGSLAFAVVVAVAGFLYFRHAGQRLHRQASDASLCANAASSLELVNPNMAGGVPNVGLSIARTTAGRVAAELSRAGASPHPWDDEPGDTVVVRCQAGNVSWIVDGRGHVARLPPP